MLADALHAPGPADPAAMDDFGRLVGAWRLHWRGLAPDGTWRRATGELHVGWVLDGRAVQDVWIVPGRGEPGAGAPALAFDGTGVRFLPPDGGRGLSAWMEPVNGRVRRFPGRARAPVPGPALSLRRAGSFFRPPRRRRPAPRRSAGPAPP